MACSCGWSGVSTNEVSRDIIYKIRDLFDNQGNKIGQAQDIDYIKITEQDACGRCGTNIGGQKTRRG